MAALLLDSAAFDVDTYLKKAEEIIQPMGFSHDSMPLTSTNGKLFVGVDLGTAYLMLVVLDEKKQPLGGQYRFAQVVRDGLVVDYIGAVDLLREMKQQVEEKLGIELTHAASGFPPGVPQVEVRAVTHVVEAAGFTCTGMIDEPSAANNLIRMRNGAIIDVGGGTTGVAVLRDGEVIYTADEATGGTHFSLVIAGALNVSFEEAEEIKKNPAEQSRLFPLIRPVMEKVGSIAAKHLEKFDVSQLVLVGGTCAFPGITEVIQSYTGIPTSVPVQPMFVTPIHANWHCNARQWVLR